MRSITFINAFTTSRASPTSITNRNNVNELTYRYSPSLESPTTSTFITPTSKFGTSTCTRAYGINHQEEQIFNDLDTIYTDASKSIKCPFWRRRVADSIDNIAMVLKFLIIRHKSIIGDDIVSKLNPTSEVRPGCKSIGVRNPDGSICKHLHLSLEELRDIIEGDWSTSNDRGYYITGRLSTEIYRDDCLFDGPDPDMPVRGLRKYLAAASHLFEAKNSYATLKSLNIVEGEVGQEYDGSEREGFGGVIVAEWTLGGVLMLPWRPEVKPWSGWTKYHFDEDGLVYHHEEGWDISVWEAFIGTMFPELWERVNGSDNSQEIR